jgi:uncharacterized protein YaeQ
MAIKSTIFKVSLQLADIDHNYYADHTLTLARHPSETDERMMVRLTALALQAHELNDTCQGDGTLTFGAGLSDPNEPDVLLRDFTNQIRLWVEVGLPEEKPLVKACGKANQVILYCFNHASEVWWRSIEHKISRAKNLQVYRIPTQASNDLIALAQRNMQLQATIQEGSLTFSDNQRSVEISPTRWK